MKKFILWVAIVIFTGCSQQPANEKTDERIISLMPSNTEILYKLGLGKHVVGVTTVDDYPAQVKKKEKFDSMNLNKEQLLKAEPTIIFAHESARPQQEKVLGYLQKKGIKVVYVKDAETLQQIDDSIMQIAQAASVEQKGQKLSDDINQSIQHIKKQYHHLNKKVFIEVSSEPDIYTGGSGTLFDDMLTKLGAENAFHDVKGWQAVSKESIVKADPDVMISTSNPTDDYRQLVKKRSGFSRVSAVQSRQVDGIDSDLISRPGPRIAEGFEALAKAIQH